MCGCVFVREKAKRVVFSGYNLIFNLPAGPNVHFYVFFCMYSDFIKKTTAEISNSI